MILIRGRGSKQVYHGRDGESVFCYVLGPNGCIREAGKEWRLDWCLSIASGWNLPFSRI